MPKFKNNHDNIIRDIMKAMQKSIADFDGPLLIKVRDKHRLDAAASCNEEQRNYHIRAERQMDMVLSLKESYG